MIAEAHARGLPAIPWTVNTTADMKRLMDLGVDGIITDYPTRLHTLMEESGLKLPKAPEVKVVALRSSRSTDTRESA